MNTSELQSEKISLINWITRLQDEVIIAQLKKIQATAEDIEFPYLLQLGVGSYRVILFALA